jgi:hypothetical protein
MNPIHILTTYSFKIHYVFPPYVHRFSKCIFASDFLTNILHIFIVSHILANLIIFDFIVLTKIGDEKENSDIEAIKREITDILTKALMWKAEGLIPSLGSIYMYMRVCLWRRENIFRGMPSPMKILRTTDLCTLYHVRSNKCIKAW